MGTQSSPPVFGWLRCCWRSFVLNWYLGMVTVNVMINSQICQTCTHLGQGDIPGWEHFSTLLHCWSWRRQDIWVEGSDIIFLIVSKSDETAARQSVLNQWKKGNKKCFNHIATFNFKIISVLLCLWSIYRVLAKLRCLGGRHCCN